MYMYLAAYLAMPLSIISCYLGEVLQPHRPSSNQQHDDDEYQRLGQRVCTATSLSAVAHRPRPLAYITRHRDKTRMDRYTARSMINNYSRDFIRCQTTVELPR